MTHIVHSAVAPVNHRLIFQVRIQIFAFRSDIHPSHPITLRALIALIGPSIEPALFISHPLRLSTHFRTNIYSINLCDKAIDVFFKISDLVTQPPTFHILTKFCQILTKRPVGHFNTKWISAVTFPYTIISKFVRHLSKERNQVSLGALPLQKNRYSKQSRVRIGFTEHIHIFGIGIFFQFNTKLRKDFFLRLALGLQYGIFFLGHQIVNTFKFKVRQQVHIRRLVHQHITYGLELDGVRGHLSSNLVAVITVHHQHHILAHQVSSRKLVTAIVAGNMADKITIRLL